MDVLPIVPLSESTSTCRMLPFPADGRATPEVPPVLEQLVTHVPDLIVYRSHDAPLPQTIHSYGVVMFGDISGFTALCEKYCSNGKSKQDGTDQLTSTLNSYLSQIVQAILEVGGDILKFAGDAFLAFWNCSRFTASSTLSHVLKESLMMQNDFDMFQTSDGVTLRMKLGLSIGRVELHYIGNEQYKTFDITGEAVDDVNKAQSLTKSGAVVISKAAWEICNKQRCFASLVGQSGFVQVNKLLPEPSEEETRQNMLPALIMHEKRRSTLDSVLQNVASARSPSVVSTKRKSESAVIRSNPWEEEKRTSISMKRKEYKNSVSMPGQFLQLGSFRPGLKDFLMKMTPEAQVELRTFVLKTVVQKLDHGHEVSWLSELRQVSVLFINLDPGQQTDAAGTLKLLQSSFDVIYPSLSKYDGSLNKVFMFDKGCTFLCIFGLPHAKHEDDTSRALEASREIFNHLRNLDLRQYSIGVTTGVAFCGVVGHPLRHEYTVIGQKVNMAARLMMMFPNAVACDETTKTKSNINLRQFSLAPPVKLKGISNPENIYTFSTESHDMIGRFCSDMHLPTDADDLIGREKEMDIFIEELMHVSEHTHRDPGVIIISGRGGLGKTKLLRAMKARAAMMGFRIISGVGGLVEQNTPFFTVKTLITRLLELDSCKNIHEREQLILHHVTDEEMRNFLPLLNDILVLKFPQTPSTVHMNNVDRTKALHKLLFSIVHQEALSKPCVFGIDDAHWIDPDSWSFLLDLALDPNAILVLTTRPLKPEQKQPAMLEILNHPHTKTIILEGLSSDDMIELACHILKVDEVPELLQQIIRERSHGVPLWCEELVETMLELQYLQVIQQDEIIMEEDEEELETEREEGGHQELSNQIENMTTALLPGEGDKQSCTPNVCRKVVLQTKTRRKSACQLNGSIEIGDIPIPDSVTGMMLARIDHMSPSEQMALKCAAIVGTSFSRSMLEAVVPNCNPYTFHQALNTLAEVGIIECAIAAEVRNMHPDIHSRSVHHLPVDDTNLHCPCLSKKNPSHHIITPHGATSHMHPPVEECEMLKFVHTYIQETAYGLWTESQRRALHESAALFLESQAHKCKNCGGGGFIAGEHQPIYERKASKSATPAGRAFIGTANVRNKFRRKSAAYTQRGSRVSRTSLDSDYFGSLSDLRRTLSSQQHTAPTITNQADVNTSKPATTDPTPARVCYQSICEIEVLRGVDLQNCHCDTVLAHVYPQLVRHWKMAGDMHKTLQYLIEAGSAAVSTFNNMEALSLLHEAKHIMEEYGETLLTEVEHARLESLIAQALFQSGQVDECMSHFKKALKLLHTKLPQSMLGAVVSLGHQAFRQWLHRKFPRKFLGRKRGHESETYLDQARCMTHVTHAYHLQHENLRTLMAALKQLNAVEEAQEDVHELVEAYATMIECCQHFDFKSLANYYLEKAMSHCTDVQFGVEDLHIYAHLLSVALNSKLCQGEVAEALEIGSASSWITSHMHDVPMQMASLPLLFYAQIASLEVEQCKETLKQLCEIASEADDLRAQALYSCCQFDALLELEINATDAKMVVASAETCCEEDVYHFDDVDRFFMVSCLALWHARHENFAAAEKYETIATGLQPKKVETFIAVQALTRLVECSLLLWKCYTAENSRKATKELLERLKLLARKFTFFKPRYLHLNAYWKHLQDKQVKARKLLNASVHEANKSGNRFDAERATRSTQTWFETTSTKHTDSSFLKLPLFTLL